MEKETNEIEEFIASLEDYQPTVPDEVTTYYLNRTGFVCTDTKMYVQGIGGKRLIALAAQKFISDIATDALQYCKIRQQASTRDKSKAREKKLVLTMEDLSQSLKEYGINLRKPEYFADKLSAGVEIAQQQAKEREQKQADRRKAATKKEKVEKDKEEKDA